MKRTFLLKTFFLLSFIFLSNSFVFADLEDTVRKQIPGSYYAHTDQCGSTDLFTYKTPKAEHNATVYLPYGYNAGDTETRYPVLYLMHGGGGNCSSYMGLAKCPNRLVNIIDHAIQNGDFIPLIIVCPNDTGAFQKELRDYLIPAIDESFNTIADREHRAFGGFSMGAVATWKIFQYDLDLVKYFVPMSGDSWVFTTTGGSSQPEKTAALVSKAKFIEQYSKTDYYIFAATGKNDSAYPNLTPQISAMIPLTERFDYTTDDFSNGNLMYYVVKNNNHTYECTYEYLYNALKLFFPK